MAVDEIYARRSIRFFKSDDISNSDTDSHGR